MATAGLSFANPALERMGVGEEPNPYAPYTPTANIGIGGLAPSAADMALMGEALVKQSQFTMPEMRRPAAIAFSPSRGELFVNGLTFSAEDAATALQSESYLRGPGTQLPVGGDWVPLDEQAYSQYLQSIRQPSLGRLASKSFGRGVDVMQALAGRGLQLAGAEELGGRIVAAQEEQLRSTSPFERQFTDIESGRDAVEWFVANFAQQGPNLIESVLTAGIGYLAGTITGGPVSGAGAALAGLMGKSAFKESVIAAAKKKAAGEVLNAAETKLLREAAGIAGAVTASYAQNLATGAADIYGELRDRGADPADVDARLKALMGSIPYAALETLPEYVLAGRLFGGMGAPRALPAGAPVVQRGAEFLRRGAVGFGVGGLAEGTTEAGQEALLLGISGQDLTSPEAANRLINSFAAGFGVGGPIGAVANLRGRQPANLLDPAKPSDPTPGRELIVPPAAPPAAPGTAVAPYYTPVTPMGAMPTPPAQLAGPPTVPQLPGPVQPVTPMGGPVIMVTPGGVAYPDQMLRQQGNVPPGAPGTQGVLDIFGGQIPAQELAARMQPPVTTVAAEPAAQPTTPIMDLRQGVLQFAPPAPPAQAPTVLGNALQQVLQQQRVAQLQQQREQELAAQREADLARLGNVAVAQRQLDLMAPAAPQPPMPMQPAGPTQPMQLPLFTRRQAPRPSRAEALRRGVPGAQPVAAAPVEVPATAAERRAQLSLFTQEGQPSVAALRAAGVTTKLPPAPAPAPVTRARGQRGLKKQAGVAAVEIVPKEKPSATQEGKLKQGRVAKRAEDNAGVRAGRPTGKQPTAQVSAGGAQAGGRGVAVKRGAKAKVVDITELRTEQIEAEDERREAEASRAAAVKMQEDLKKRYTPVIQDLIRRMRVIREALRTTPYPNSLEARALSDPFAGYIESFNRLTSPDYLDQINEFAVGMFERSMTDPVDGLPAELALVEKNLAAIQPKKKTQALKRGAKPQEEVKPAVAAALKKGELVQAGRQWGQYADPDTQPKWADLSDAQKEAWRKVAIEDRRPNIAAAEEIAPPKKAEAAPAAAPAPVAEAAPAAPAAPAEETDAELLADAIRDSEAATDTRAFTNAISTVIEYAFFDTDPNNRPLGEQARAFLANTQFQDNQQSIIDNVFLDQANNNLQLTAVVKEKNRPWFSYALSRNLMPSITAKIINLPAIYKTQQSPVSGKIATSKPVETSAEKITTTPQALLGQLISDLITQIRTVTNLNQQVKFREQTYNNIVELAKELYAKTDKQGRKYIVRGSPLSDYFTDKGEPKMLKSGGRFLISTEVLTTAQQRKLEQEQKAAAEALAEEEADIRIAEAERARLEKKGFREENAWDNDDGMFYRDDGTEIPATVPVGRIRLLVKSFLNKLRMKPTVHIYANVEDLKQRNPELYARAAAARGQGDFDTTKAAGYSFGQPEVEGLRLTRRQFLRGAGATLGALNLPKLSNEAELHLLVDAWNASIKAYDAWFSVAAKFAKTASLRDFAQAQIGTNGESLLDLVRTKELRDFLYRVEYDVNYQGDGYDYALSELLSKNGGATLADFHQAMQQMRQRFLSEAEQFKDKYPGSHVIIFTDFIRTEQQLKFVLAHETLGHFGFKGVVPKAQLDKVLNRIYDVDPDVQAAVDAMVASQGMSKLEAIEEYLADNAADLDTSIIARIWNVLKNFLNKLGFTFQDDEARYFVNQARKYVRRGDTGNFVSASAIVGDMQQLDQDRDDGRYARFAAGDLASRAFTMGGLNRPYSATGGLMGAAEAFTKRVFGQGRNVPGIVASLLEQVQTLDNKARRSYGLNQIYRILERQQQFARSLLSKYQRMTAFTHSPDIGFFGEGVSEDDKLQAGELLARAALLRSQQATDEAIKKYPSLVTIDDAGNITVDPRVRAEIEKAGFVTAEEFRKGFDITYSNGEKVRFQFDVDENSPVWKVYTEMRETVNEAAIDLMLANYETAQAEERRVVTDLNAKRRGTNVFTQDDLAAIRRAAAMYQNMRYEGSDVANAGVEIKRKANKDSEDFLIAFGRALFNDDVFAVWMKDPAAKPEIAKDLAEFQKAEYDDIRAALPSLREKVKTDQQSYQVQKAIRDLFLFDLQSKNADYYAKRTILGSYVPFTRRGSEQVKLVAVDERGNPVALDEGVRSTLPYFQFDTRDEALTAAEELEQEFGGDNEWTLKDEGGNDIKVRFKAEVSKTRQSPDLTEAVNFNEFVYVLNRLNINLAPEARERIVTTLTNQNARARRNLQRSGTEGWDKDVIRSVSEHLETSAHVAAKKLYRHRLDDILLTESNWLGDDQKLRALKAAVDAATSDGERARAQREYDEYAYMYRYMKATGRGNTVEIDGKQVPTLGRGEDYREEAKQVLRWYSEATNITDSTEDMLSGEVGSRLKMITVLMQLGGSVATAVINLASLVTHSLPYLSYYNSRRGFGGGYGEAKAASALWKAATDVANPKLSDDAFLNEMLRDGTYDRYGLTQDEAQFLFEQTEAGTLQAAQFNALVGTARGKVFNNKAQAAIKLWMSMFSYTEQANRRVTALAAYRLEKERLQAQGITDEQQLIAEATEAARNAVNTAQGEYAMFNRPEMARGNVLQYVFMYKQFVIVTVQLLRSMPMQGQLMMLGFLLLASGLKGLPFAEDIFDIVDTIAQKLGLKMASVEKELATWIDAVAPGMTPYVMRGVLDRATGATMSTRLGMGDLIPLTGVFRAGADPAREISDFAGPVFSGIAGLVGMAGSLAKYGAEVTGLRDDTTSLNSILRDSPLAAVRAIGDSYAYLNSGAITNARGQLVASEAPYHVILARLLGFYPAIATEQNDIVRLSKNVADYSKAIKAEYVSAYVKAKLANDTGRMQEIVQDVAAWNEDAKGTGLEITTFVKSANRAALEAARPTVLRYLKAAPKQMRPETIELLRINGLEDEVR
jgi:hypothetical protein